MSEEQVKKTYAKPEDKFPGPGPGRPPGSANKFTSLKAKFLEAFELTGDVTGLVSWITANQHNRGDFYKMLSKMLPSNVIEEIAGELRVKLEKVITDTRPDE
jgi:hypothetical protein